MKRASSTSGAPPAKRAKATPDLAQSISRLGTETAYAVALEAKALAASGKKVYPLHIGDLNYPTPSVVKDAVTKALADGKTGYCPAAGIPALRTALADFMTESRGVAFAAENVSVQPGGKAVIGKFLMCCADAGDEVIFPSPGYPIYESQIDFLGCVPKPYGFVDTPDGLRMDLDAMEAHITPKTKVIIYNNFNNPTGATSTPAEMQRVADLAQKHNLWVLSDEAYWDLVYEGEAKSIVALPGMQERTLILHTFSKSWSMTGWRLGAAVGPVDLITQITRLNTNQEACTCHFVQEAGVVALTDPAAKQFIVDLRASLKARRDALVPAINAVPGLQCHSPKSTFYLWIDATGAMETMGISALEEFRKKVLGDTGVSFCTREHFGRSIPGEAKKYIRFAYSGIDTEVALEACNVLTKYFNEGK